MFWSLNCEGDSFVFLAPVAPGATRRQSIVIPDSCPSLLSGRTVAAPTKVGQ